jgi:hypothetical protein
MNRLSTLAATVAALVIATVGLHSQDLSQYREFRLGNTLASVEKATGVATGEAKSIQQRPARIEELRWRPSERYNDRMAPTEPVREVIFTFYNDQLFKMVIEYDPQRTAGLTDTDLIDVIGARYGVPILQASSLPTYTAARVAPSDGDVVARWADADTSVTLVRGIYPTTLRLTLTLTSTEALAQNAIVESARLDRAEAPQRELERVNKLAEDRRAASEKARIVNKPLFKP